MGRGSNTFCVTSLRKRSPQANYMKRVPEFYTEKEKGLIKRRKKAKMSHGESKIAEFLKNNAVEFYQEWYFKEFTHKGKMKFLFYDFYIPKYRLCIEYDGEQHYSKEFKGRKLKKIEEHDFMKTAFCHKKGLRLLRIPYWELNNIENRICEYFDVHGI